MGMVGGGGRGRGLRNRSQIIEMIQPKDILLVCCLCGAEYLVLLELCKMRFPCHHAESFRDMSSFSLVWEATPITKMHILNYESL